MSTTFLYVNDLGPRSRNDLDLQYSHTFMKSMKKGNKQCLFDTPRTVMVNKEMMSEYLDHKNNSVCPIIAQS